MTDWAASGSVVTSTSSAAVLPTQRRRLIGAEIPVARSADKLSAGSWPSGWSRRLELASVCILGMSTVVATAGGPVALGALAIWVVGAYCRTSTVSTSLREELRIVTSAAVFAVVLLAIASAAGGLGPQGMQDALVSVALPAGLAAVLRGFRLAFGAPARVVAVGDRAFVAREVSRRPHRSRSHVVAAVVAEQQLSARDVPSQIMGTPSYGDLDRIREVVAAHAGDLVLVDSRQVPGEDLRRLGWALEGTRVEVCVAGILDSVAPNRLRARSLGRDSVLDVRSPGPSRPARGVKWVCDRTVGLLALMLVSPLLALIMLAIRCDSKGPAMFIQTRVGKDGKNFRLYKLRTMVADADENKHLLAEDNEAGSVLFKVRQDPRVTRLGRFLRRSSLDELPQLINVVRGEMSLVGPRPFLPAETAQMGSDELRRLVVRPGMTGLWQVSGRSDLGWTESVRLDLWYADNCSLGKDAEIVVRTVGAVLGGKGAY